MQAAQGGKWFSPRGSIRSRIVASSSFDLASDSAVLAEGVSGVRPSNRWDAYSQSLFRHRVPWLEHQIGGTIPVSAEPQRL